MEKIIQLTQSEYSKLCELAHANECDIENRADELWKRKAVAEINVNVDCGKDYDDTFSIKCDTYMFYKDEKFHIPYELRNRISKIIEESVLDQIENRFGGLTKAINIVSKNQESLNRAKYWLWAIAASGWGAFVSYLFSN